jgi:hypothetical protein
MTKVSNEEQSNNANVLLCADWFLLTEKKPDNQQEIIFFSDYVYVGVWWDNSNTVNGNMPGCYDDEISKKDITHWMQFPQKPICT